MARTDRPDAADPQGNAKGAPPEKREPMAGLLASSPSKAIGANEFDPREAFFPKVLLTAEDLRGGAPAAKPAAAPSSSASTPAPKPAYVPDPGLERRSPLGFFALLMFLALAAALGGGAYWYFVVNRGAPASASAPAATPASPNAKAGTIAPAAAPVTPAGPPPASTAASAPAPAPAQHISHTKGGGPEPARPVEPARARSAEPAPVAAAPPSAPAKAPTKACLPQVAALGLCTP